MLNKLLPLVFGLLLGAPLSAQSPDDAARGYETATFAGGCFWCMEPPYDKVDGVISTTSGYMGGHVQDPTYEAVSTGKTGHAEVVQVVFDPAKVNYDALLDVFWRNIDPLDGGGQFCDRGTQYRSAIFYADEEQKRLAEQSKKSLEKSGVLPGKIETEIVPAGEFYAATEDHQNFYQKNPLRYNFYKFTCGRDGRLEELWSAE